MIKVWVIIINIAFPMYTSSRKKIKSEKFEKTIGALKSEKGRPTSTKRDRTALFMQ